MAQRKKQLIAEGKLDKHGRPNAETPPEYLRALPDANGCEAALCHAVVRSTWHAFAPAPQLPPAFGSQTGELT